MRRSPRARRNYVGDAVAVVLADTLAQAKDAAEKVVVDYEELPAVVDPAKAAAKGAPLIHESAPNNTIYNWHLGDPDATNAALREAKHVTKLEFINNRLVPNAMEPRAALADYDAASGGLTLWNATQNPHVARLVISAFVGMAPENKLRVIAPDVGGGFGSKIFIYPEEVVCLWAARKLSRPVKWTAERSESFITDAHGRDHVTKAQMAFDGDGKITGLKVHTTANLGAYMSTFSSAVPTFLYATLLSGQYEIPHIYCEVDAVYTNTVPVDAYRGAGRPEATFVVERLVEAAAARTRHRSGRIAEEEFRQDISRTRPRSLRSMTPAITMRRCRRRWKSTTTRASPNASASPSVTASCAASALRPISRRAASRHRRWSASSAPASACGNPPRCGSIRPAPSRF